MAWYWIVCIAFCYFLLGAIIGEVWDAIAGCNQDLKAATMFIWPFVIVFGIAFCVGYLIQALGKFLANTILARIKDIVNLIYRQRQKRRQKKAQKALCPKNKKGCSKKEIDDIDYDGRKR